MSQPPAEVAGRPVVAARRIGGGDINDAFAVDLRGGGRAFVKTRDGAAPGEYEAEAAGLRWLGEGGALVPEVLDVGDAFLALEWLDPSSLSAAGEEELGRTLAATHRAGARRWGETPDGRPTRIGPILLPNDPAADWATFYAERRLLPLAERAGLEAEVAPVVDRIAELAGPEEPPSRLHGDLWSGNVLPSGGRPYLIDPAVYGGHREVDLAMLGLFGGAGSRTLAAYDEVLPRADGHERRVALYELLPLLVHAVLFGGSYVSAVGRAAARALG